MKTDLNTYLFPWDFFGFDFFLLIYSGIGAVDAYPCSASENQSENNNHVYGDELSKSCRCNVAFLKIALKLLQSQNYLVLFYLHTQQPEAEFQYKTYLLCKCINSIKYELTASPQLALRLSNFVLTSRTLKGLKPSLFTLLLNRR